MSQRLRAYTENLETFFLEVILGERRGTRAALVRAFLYLCSKGFHVAILSRRSLYNLRLLRDSTLGVQVIAIGNLTVGGTGKTPVVEKFARELQDQGRQRGDSFARLPLETHAAAPAAAQQAFPAG